MSLERTGQHDEASHTYRPIIAYLARIIVLKTLPQELRRWTEELLTHICLFYSVASPSQPAQLGEAMAAFHQLSRLLDTQSGQLSPRVGTLTKDSPRAIWKAYYEALSLIVGKGLVYHPSPVHRDHESLEHRGLLEDADYLTARKLQRTDIRRVESNYEALLMRETQFPKAGENNEAVKAFVENVMRNWRAFCGPSWIERELEDGGKTAIGRRTLDFLYRAATKTFHSTQILRHLFTVHAYLAEFDLAFKSLVSYMEILTKGKARLEKSGDAGVDLDDDDIAFNFVAETIRVACRYGGPDAAETALYTAATLSHWLTSGSLGAQAEHGGEKRLIKTWRPQPNAKFSPGTRALALRSVGIALANWSRYTWEASIRSDCQQAAAAHLEVALDQGLADSHCTETLFSLSVLYAEMRLIDDALDLVKRALRAPEEAIALANPQGVMSSSPDEVPDSARGQILRSQKMLPLWHLLAQLLSALGEYSGAIQACENAFAAFGQVPGIAQSSPAEPKGSSSAAESFLDSFERQLLLEVKMTHVSLLETSEGPETAINATDDLLALYAHVYGPVRPQGSQGPTQVAKGPSRRSSAGTVRGIFHRHRHAKHLSLAPTNGTESRPTTAVGSGAPSIHVTQPGDADGALSSPERKHHSLRKAVSIRGKKSKEPVENHDEKREPVSEGSGTQVVPSVPHNINPEKEPPPVGHPQPPVQDTRLPVPPPAEDRSQLGVHFSKIHENRQRLSALVKVWLFVARLYRAAGQIAEAADALDEADRVVETLELDVASSEPSVRRLRETPWGSNASVDSLWADAYAEVCGISPRRQTEQELTHSQRGLLYEAEEHTEAALTSYENALAHIPDHPEAIAGLGGLLLDSYEKRPTADVQDSSAGTASPASPTMSDASALPLDYDRQRAQVPETAELYLLAARDRAYGLLASVIKLGCGWDHSESWIVYARALEASGQIEKAKEALWWTVKLEDSRPVRHWSHTCPGGYVL